MPDTDFPENEMDIETDGKLLNIADLKELGSSELTGIAKDLGVAGVSGMRKQELIFQILKAQTEKSGQRQAPRNDSFLVAVSEAAQSPVGWPETALLYLGRHRFDNARNSGIMRPAPLLDPGEARTPC
ncbi:MAG: Rho termination factor N-terminal domain-containing protein [Anaerolineae bacterium]